jgi:hypothetical protein
MAGKLGSLLRSWATSEDTATFAATAERLRRQGQLPRAVEVCREGLKKFPDQLSARVTLGWALLDLGDYDEARGELEYVIHRAPDNLAAIRGLAQLHDRSENAALLALEHGGEWPPSLEDIERALSDQRDGTDLAKPGEGPAAAEHRLDAGPATGPDQEAAGDEALPESAVELLEEAEALEAIADDQELAGESETLDLDPAAEVDLEELASELAKPSDRADADQSGASEPDTAGPRDESDAAEEPIVLDAESLSGDLNDLVELDSGESDGGASGDGPGPESSAPQSAEGPVRTESTLDALERLLDQVKGRRQQVTSNSAA